MFKHKIITAAVMAACAPAFAQSAPASPQAAKPAPAQSAPLQSALPRSAPAAVAAAPASASSGEAMATVTVVAERSTNRVDRQVYDVKSDVAAPNETVADALAKVPAVTVDAEGSVTLRGNANVQILVDGKPSAMLQGEGRGAALKSIPAGDVASVEVINQPGAEFGNEGGGAPIINLVMQRTRRAGGFVNMNANYGTAGRYNAYVSGNYNEGLFGLQGRLNVRRDSRNGSSNTVRDRINPLAGTVQHSITDSRYRNSNDSFGATTQLTYNATADDTLGASLQYNGRASDTDSLSRFQSLAASGAIDTDYLLTGVNKNDNRNYGAGLRWDRKGRQDLNESIKHDLRISGDDSAGGNRSASVYTDGNPLHRDRRSRQGSDTSARLVDLSGDYARSVGKDFLSAGYKWTQNRSEFDRQYLDIDPGTGAEAVDARLTNRFRLTERVFALYGSYELRLGDKWGLKGGLRAEYTDLDIQQLTTRVDAGNSYLDYLPSLYLSYRAAPGTNIRLQYAQRLRRPGAYELNPFIVYRDEFNQSSGNPSLLPTKTDSAELRYESKLAGMDASAALYARQESDAILDRRYFISDTVLLTTRQNGPGTRAEGLELVLSGKLLQTLTVNASVNLQHSEQRVVDLSGAQNVRSVSSVSGKAYLRYAATPQDTLQFNLTASGRQLYGQTVRGASVFTNLSYQRKLGATTSLLLSVSDLFNSANPSTRTDSDTLKQYSTNRANGRVLYAGLSYTYGSFQQVSATPRPAAGAVRTTP